MVRLRTLGLMVVIGMIAAWIFAVPGAGAATNCFASPHVCGYPDATTSGVPAGTTLTPSGSKTVTTNGQVLRGLEINGTVTVAADNVTIENSRISRSSGGNGTYAVILNSGADNFTIKNSEVTGPASTSSGTESAVWNHYDNPGATASGVYFHHCADCWEGSGTFTNSYMVVDAGYSGSHDENIYVCGGTVNVNHSTLINTNGQTATVFGDTICGPNQFTVTNSLLSGGGYLLYPQANSSSSVGTMNVSGNRFARCTSGSHYDSGSGGTSCTGATTTGYFPLGGYYGVAAYVYSGGSNVWTNNVWDDSSQPVCPDGSSGCGVAWGPPSPTEPVPPTEEPVPPAPTEEPVPPAKETVPAPPKTKSPKSGGHHKGSSTNVVSAVEAGAGSTTTATAPAAHAVWTSPATAPPGHRIRLNGAGSTGAMPIACVWTVTDGSGKKVLDRKRGCVSALRLPERGGRTVRLTVTGSNAASDSIRHTIRVLTGPPALTLSAAQIAAAGQ